MTSSGQGQPKKKNINEKELTEFFIAVEEIQPRWTKNKRIYWYNKSGRHLKVRKKKYHIIILILIVLI